jgi:BexC/CtrB/KpsE family polysaccharide export inner-membrane protein
MLSSKFTFFVFVLIPLALASLYYGHFASNRYISESRYIIEGNNKQSTDVLGVVSGLTGVSSSSADSLTVMSYIISHDFIKKVSKQVDLHKEYSKIEYDWLARLPFGSSEEDLLDYWDNNIISITFDPGSGISTLEVTAFSAEIAEKISRHTLLLSERFINDLSLESKADALKLAQDEVIKAETELLLFRSKLANLSKKEKVISAEQSASAEQGIVAQLKQRLATSEAELKKLGTFMQPNSLKIRSLRNEINSIKKQITSQQEKWSDTSSGNTVTSVVLDTERLKSELAFAESVYINAVTSLKQAQIESTQKRRYLDVIVPPHLPDESLDPDRLFSILTTFLASLMIWGIISLILTSIKDHLGWT